MQTESIVVAENIQGKYGAQVKDTNGDYFSFGKFYKGPTAFGVGDVLKIELYKTEKGNKYINKVLSADVATASTTPKAEPSTEKKAPAFKAKADTSMSKDEWKAKDRSQLVGGLCHDAAQLTLTALTVGEKPEVVLKTYEEILNGLIELRDGMK